MRVTMRTNLALRALMMCAVNTPNTVKTADIAARCNASLNHLAYVVNILQAHGILETQRGRSGGIRLAKSTQDISIGSIFRIMEATVPIAECFDSLINSCPLVENCRLRGHLHLALQTFYTSLDAVPLSELVDGNCGLTTLLSLYPPEINCRNEQELLPA